MRHAVVDAVGSNRLHESPFWHTTLDRDTALEWFHQGRSIKEDNLNYLVRINLTSLREDYVIDMSTPHAQDLFSEAKQ